MCSKVVFLDFLVGVKRIRSVLFVFEVVFFIVVVDNDVVELIRFMYKEDIDVNY